MQVHPRNWLRPVLSLVEGQAAGCAPLQAEGAREGLRGRGSEPACAGLDVPEEQPPPAAAPGRASGMGSFSPDAHPT